MKFTQKKTHKKWIRSVYFVLSISLGCLLSAGLIGCGSNAFESIANDDSPEAQLEDARIALDDENYTKAADILEGMDQSDEMVRQYLSNAYSGMAGLDTFGILETIENINESNTEGSVDMVGQVLGDVDENGESTATLSRSSLRKKMSNFTNSIDALMNVDTNSDGNAALRKTSVIDGSSFCADIRTLTDDQQVQLGLISICRAILNISQIVMDDNNLESLKLTEKEFRRLYAGRSAININFAALFGNDELGNTINRLDLLSEDIVQIACSLEAILRIINSDASNDLADNFNEFLSKIDNLQQDNKISQSELEHFIQSL